MPDSVSVLPRLVSHMVFCTFVILFIFILLFWLGTGVNSMSKTLNGCDSKDLENKLNWSVCCLKINIYNVH